jgi:hypothetical protein
LQNDEPQLPAGPMTDERVLLCVLAVLIGLLLALTR